mgnify:CR=1 FL=1
MKEVTSQHSGAHPVYSEKDMSYCTKLWKNRGGACTRGEVSYLREYWCIICELVGVLLLYGDLFTVPETLNTP